MNMPLYQFIFSVAQFIFTAGIGFYVYISNQDKVTNDRIGSLETELGRRIAGHAERIARLEEAGQHVPTHEDLGELHERINAVAESMNTLTGEVRGMQNTLSLIHQHLLTGGLK
ncbi:MAG: hypothetical protein VB131_07700 [Burkholderia gladioli]